MSDVKWIKVLTTIFEDEKIRLIQSMPEGDALIVIWLKLLTQTGKSNYGGYLRMNEQTPYTPEMLSVIFGKSQPIINLALTTFEQFGMIRNTPEGIYIVNWEKHQNVEGMERVRELNRLRKQKERERKKLPPPEQMSRDCHVTSQQNHATEEELELELDKDKDNLTTPEKEILNILKSVKNYPFDYETDLDHIRALTIDFPNSNIQAEAKKWATYKLDKPLTKKSNPRLQLRNWIEKSKEFNKSPFKVRQSNNQKVLEALMRDEI